MVWGRVGSKEGKCNTDDGNYPWSNGNSEQEGWSSRPQTSHWLFSIHQINSVPIIYDLLSIMLE